MELTEKYLFKEIDMRSRILICFAAAALAVIGFFSAASGCQSEPANISPIETVATPPPANPDATTQTAPENPAKQGGTDLIIPIEKATADRVDSLEGYYRGIRPGDWCKLLVQGHHIQVWTCFEVKRDGESGVKVSWSRKLYDDKGDMYQTLNASETIEESENEYKNIGADPSYTVNCDCVSITLPTGKQISGRVIVRRTTYGSVCRIICRENKLGGCCFSMWAGKIAYVLLDFGREDRIEGKTVKASDVAAAGAMQKKWIEETLPKYIPKADLSVKEEDVEEIVKKEFQKQKYDENLERDASKIPDIDKDKIVEKPAIIEEDEFDNESDLPRGASFEDMAGKGSDNSAGVGAGAAEAYAQRWGHSRKSFEKINEGGKPGSEDAVVAALRWLHFHQSEDGRWDCDGFSKNCKKGKCDGEAQAPYFDVGVTGLALLAYLGNGQTHKTGEFKKTVRKGLRFLKSEQSDDGRIGPCEGDSWFYNSAIALYALSEAYGMTKDATIKEMALKTLSYGLNSQNPGYGWKYEPKGGKNDTSVTGWMVLALKAAEAAGLEVPKQAFEDARKWFDRVTASNGRCGYEKPGDPGSRLRGQTKQFERQECMTSVALLCRIMTGQNRSDWQIKKGAELLMAKLPTYDEPNHLKVNYYYWYYGTNAMFQIGGADWDKWNGAMKRALVKTQRRGGCRDGSWDSECEWGIVGGRAYCTAINALTLETYYRYKRFEKDAEDKKPTAESDKPEESGAKSPAQEEKPKGE
jgi:hypothetical protein